MAPQDQGTKSVHTITPLIHTLLGDGAITALYLRTIAAMNEELSRWENTVDERKCHAHYRRIRTLRRSFVYYKGTLLYLNHVWIL